MKGKIENEGFYDEVGDITIAVLDGLLKEYGVGNV